MRLKMTGHPCERVTRFEQNDAPILHFNGTITYMIRHEILRAERSTNSAF